MFYKKLFFEIKEQRLIIVTNSIYEQENVRTKLSLKTEGVQY